MKSFEPDEIKTFMWLGAAGVAGSTEILEPYSNEELQAILDDTCTTPIFIQGK